MDIKNLNFGQDSAESERDNLRYIFLATPFFKRLKSTQKWLVLGRKGAGKTAMGLMFFEQIKSSNPISLLSPKDLSSAKALLLDKASINADESAIQKWKLVFLLEASRYIVHWACENFSDKYIKWPEPLRKVRSFLVSHDESSTNQFDKAIRFVRSINKIAISAFKIEGSLELNRQLQDGDSLSDDIDNMSLVIKEAANLVKHDLTYFLVDQVDDLWDSSKEGQNLIIGLLKAAKEINDNLGFVKVVVFLRSDIFGYLRFSNPDHFRSHTEYIEWDVESLKKLIALRIHNSTGAKGDVDDLWLSVFPRRVRNIDSFEFIVQYTLMRPRDLIQLCNKCQEMALNRDSNEISPQDIEKAITKYSIWKSEDLISEYYVQYPFLEKILLGILYASPNYEIPRERFEQLFSVYKDDLIKQYGNKYFEPIDILLQSLFNIGFLGVVNHGKVLYEVLGDKVIMPHANLFHVHRAFRSGLRIKDENYRASLIGDGAIAQGSGATAVGAGGFLISGSVDGNIVIGDTNKINDK